MSRHKFARPALGALAVLVMAALAVPALAAAPRNTQLKTIGGTKLIINRSITESLRFNRDLTTIQTGGKLTLIDRSKAPHTFSVVKAGQVPKNLRQVEGCFGKGPCDELAIAHGAVNPDTGEEQDPTTPVVNAGKAGVNTAGDSVLIPPGGKTSVKITAGAGSTLNIICAIHPWMQNKVKVAKRAG
jgi:plastocyanin